MLTLKVERSNPTEIYSESILKYAVHVIRSGMFCLVNNHFFFFLKKNGYKGTQKAQNYSYEGPKLRSFLLTSNKISLVKQRVNKIKKKLPSFYGVALSHGNQSCKEKKAD